MAQIKYGSGITGIKGSLGGHVYQGGNCGAIIRQKMGKNMPKSNAFINQQSIFREVAGAWNNLSASVKQAWNEVAHTWPHTNRFGDAIQVSGYNVFMETNILGLMAGHDINDVAFEYPPVQPNTFGTGTVNYANEIINISYTAWIGPYQHLMLFISDPIPVVSVRRSSKYYFAGITSFDGTYQPNVWNILNENPHFKPDPSYYCNCLPIVISSTYNSWFRYSPFKIQDDSL